MTKRLNRFVYHFEWGDFEAPRPPWVAPKEL